MRNGRYSGNNSGHEGENDDVQNTLRQGYGNNRENADLKFNFDMKPTDVKAYLDRYVIGQDRAKKVLANGVCYHFKRVSRELESQRSTRDESEYDWTIDPQNGEDNGQDSYDRNRRLNRLDDGSDVLRALGRHGSSNASVNKSIDNNVSENAETYRRVPSVMEKLEEDKNQKYAPHKNGHIKKNILLIGNTGVGKTYLVSKLSHLIGVPFVKADMTKFSATGYVGGDVEDTIRDLYMKADNNKALAEIGMVYLDEFDKIASYSMSVGKDVNGLEVQRTLLKLLEETEVSMAGSKNPMMAMQAGRGGGQEKINTKNILFICSGAFPGLEGIVKPRLTTGQNWGDYVAAQDLVSYGMEAELIGRIPVRAVLNDLSREDLYRIMTKSEDSIIPKYQQDFAEYGISLNFTDEALKVIAERAAKTKVGARALVGTIEDILLDFMYALPSTDVKELTVSPELIYNPKEYMDKLLGKQKTESKK